VLSPERSGLTGLGRQQAKAILHVLEISAWEPALRPLAKTSRGRVALTNAESAPRADLKNNGKLSNQLLRVAA
jgi:hypothetical protein